MFSLFSATRSLSNNRRVQPASSETSSPKPSAAAPASAPASVPPPSQVRTGLVDIVGIYAVPLFQFFSIYLSLTDYPPPLVFRSFASPPPPSPPPPRFGSFFRFLFQKMRGSDAILSVIFSLSSPPARRCAVPVRTEADRALVLRFQTLAQYICNALLLLSFSLSSPPSFWPPVFGTSTSPASAFAPSPPPSGWYGHYGCYSYLCG